MFWAVPHSHAVANTNSPSSSWSTSTAYSTILGSTGLCGLSKFPVAIACAENDSSSCSLSSLVYSLLYSAHKHGLVVMICAFVMSMVVCSEVQHLAVDKKNPKTKPPQNQKNHPFFWTCNMVIKIKYCYVKCWSFLYYLKKVYIHI